MQIYKNFSKLLYDSIETNSSKSIKQMRDVQFNEV